MLPSGALGTNIATADLLEHAAHAARGMSTAALCEALAIRLEAAAGDVYNRLLPIAKKFDDTNLDSLGILLSVIGNDCGVDFPDAHATKWLEKNKEAFSRHRPYGGYIAWLGREFGKVIDGDAAEAYAEWLEQNLSSLDKILKGKDVGRLTLQEVMELAREHQSKEQERLAKDEEVVSRLPDGTTLRRLTKLAQIRNEGNQQGNCCGDELHAYDRYAEENGWDPAQHLGGIYSLRSPTNKRLATVEIQDDGEVSQKRGKANSVPSREVSLKVDEAVAPLVSKMLNDFGGSDAVRSFCKEASEHTNVTRLKATAQAEAPIDDVEWAIKLTELTVRKIVPLALRTGARILTSPAEKASLEAAAVLCEHEGTKKAASSAQATANNLLNTEDTLSHDMAWVVQAAYAAQNAAAAAMEASVRGPAWGPVSGDDDDTRSWVAYVLDWLEASVRATGKISTKAWPLSVQIAIQALKDAQR